jgi:predicted AlkP superfamily phosphohydrolase/phosphomutase
MNSRNSSNPTKPKQLDSTLCAPRPALCSEDPITSPIPVIRGVWDAEEIYSGPYKDQAPDLTVGWEDGYRASWESVTGKLKEPIIEDNTKAWSGDHCVDTDIVPGIFFSNRKIEIGVPRMVDIAPTILGIFDVKKPAYIDGTPFALK